MGILELVAQRHQGVCGLPESTALLPASLLGRLPEQWISASEVEYGAAEWPSMPLTSELELQGPIPQMVVKISTSWGTCWLYVKTMLEWG